MFFLHFLFEYFLSKFSALKDDWNVLNVCKKRVISVVLAFISVEIARVCKTSWITFHFDDVSINSVIFIFHGRSRFSRSLDVKCSIIYLAGFDVDSTLLVDGDLSKTAGIFLRIHFYIVCRWFLLLLLLVSIAWMDSRLPECCGWLGNLFLCMKDYMNGFPFAILFHFPLESVFTRWNSYVDTFASLNSSHCCVIFNLNIIVIPLPHVSLQRSCCCPLLFFLSSPSSFLFSSSSPFVFCYTHTRFSSRALTHTHTSLRLNVRQLFATLTHTCLCMGLQYISPLFFVCARLRSFSLVWTCWFCCFLSSFPMWFLPFACVACFATLTHTTVSMGYISGVQRLESSVLFLRSFE